MKRFLNLEISEIDCGLQRNPADASPSNLLSPSLDDCFENEVGFYTSANTSKDMLSPLPYRAPSHSSSGSSSRKSPRYNDICSPSMQCFHSPHLSVVQEDVKEHCSLSKKIEDCNIADSSPRSSLSSRLSDEMGEPLMNAPVHQFFSTNGSVTSLRERADSMCDEDGFDFDKLTQADVQTPCQRENALIGSRDDNGVDLHCPSTQNAVATPLSSAVAKQTLMSQASLIKEKSMLSSDASPPPTHVPFSRYSDAPSLVRGTSLNFDNPPSCSALAKWCKDDHVLAKSPQTRSSRLSLCRRVTEPYKANPPSTPVKTPEKERCYSQSNEYAPGHNPRFFGGIYTPQDSFSSQICGNTDNDWGESEASLDPDLEKFEKMFIVGLEGPRVDFAPSVSRGIFPSSMASAFGQKVSSIHTQ